MDRSPGQQPWFAEALNYRDASGRFKDGNIAEASFTGSGVSVPHRYTYEYDEHGRLLSAKAAALNPRTPPPGNWDVKGMDGKPIGYDANGNIVSITQGGTAYFYEAGTNRLAGTDEPLQGLVLSFEPGEAGRLHPWTRNPEFKENEWYCRNSMYEATTEIPLTKKDRHSGTQSLQLNDLLSSRLRASPQASRYVFKAWVKNNVRDARSPVSMQIAIPDGKVMVGKSIPYTEGEWWLFECAVESKDVAAGTVLQAALSNRAGGKVDPHFPVFVDEVFFGIDSADYLRWREGLVLSFEPGEACRLHPWTRNPEFKENEWYCRNSMYEATTEIPLTKKDRHSGTQSLQLNDLLSSRLRASPQASRYVFKAWVKNNVRDARSPVSMQIAIPDGKVMVGKSIPYTEGEWWLFECAVESKDVAAGTVLQAALSNRAGGKVDPHFPVFVDEVFFGIDSADYIYDAKGCVIRGRHLRQLQYEPLTGLTREIQAELQSGSTRQTRTVKLQYGAQGRRVLKTAISRDSSESAGVRSIIDTVQTRLYLHGTNAYPLGEESKTSSTETLMGTVPSGIGYSQIGSAAYIYGIGGLLAMREGEQTYFFCKDHLGSVRVVLDHDSQVCAGFDYLPFGEPSNSPSTKRFHYLYTGQEFDSEIGLYNYRARMYDPRHGRFYAPDPAHQYASPYEYVGNNPINLVDPAGTKAQGLSALVRALSHGEDLWKALALGAGTGAIAGTFSEGISLIHYYSVHPELSAGPGEIFGKILIGTAVGAAGGVVGAGAGFFADLGISRGLLSVWLSRDSRLSQDLVRGFGVGRGLLSGSVSSLAAQLTSNIITAAQGQTVNWGVSLGAATGIGGVFGGVSGWFASTRMRVGGTWLKATTAKGVKPSRYKAVSDNDDYISARGRGWHDYIADTVGEQWGSSVSAGSGLLGGLAASALVEWS